MVNQRSRLDRAFYALSDGTRRSIVDRLTRGRASVSELAEPAGMSLVAVMQHIRVLEESGLVRTHKAGRVRTCELDPEGLKPVEEWLAQRRSFWEARFDRLAEILAESEPEKGKETS